MTEPATSALPDFSHLTPDTVLHLVEQALGRRCSNLCRPLTSYINRVYEVQMDDESWVVAKFYRPGRWSRAALQDEEDFLCELARQEISVIEPVRGANGEILQEHQGTYFAVFPKKGGRTCDEFSLVQYEELGRLLARMHAVGAARAPRDRIAIGPRLSTAQHVSYILESEFVVPRLKAQYEETVESIVELITPLFEGAESIRIHGDCHRANILWRPGEPFHLIDFDDMAVGPPVQDLWMLLPGHRRESQQEINHLLDGYETFRDFDHRSLRLIEPLRAMRFLHFTAWCARQKADGGFARVAPDWGTAEFWKQEIQDLEQQRQEILDAMKETA